ncbi:MAG: hypothetical protein OEW60_08260 [Thiovulaceae bacterium]|nr:hypothetical protein [Sulfurimonadaceae bacterium]
MRLLMLIILSFQLSFALDKVAFVGGTGAISLSSNKNLLNLGYVNVGAVVYYPWFDTNIISGALIDMMIYEPTDPQAYDPTLTQTPHDLGIITSIGFNLGYKFDIDLAVYGGLKYSTNQISGVSGDGFAFSLNLEYDFNDQIGMGVSYKEGSMRMHLADKLEHYTSTGLYVIIRQKEPYISKTIPTGQ